MFLKDKGEVKDLIVVGDRVLVKPKSNKEKTPSGLYLPPGVQEMVSIQYGYVVKVGPGYLLPPNFVEDTLKDNFVKYLPLQAKEGDLAIYIHKNAIEIVYENQKYFIVPQLSILLLERDPNLFE